MLLEHVCLVAFSTGGQVQPSVLWDKNSVTHTSIQKIPAAAQVKIYQ